MTQQWGGGGQPQWPAPQQQGWGQQQPQQGWSAPGFGQAYGQQHQWAQPGQYGRQGPSSQQGAYGPQGQPSPQAHWGQPGPQAPWGQPDPQGQWSRGPWGQPTPMPTRRRGPGRVISIALGLVGLAFVGLMLASLLGGPRYENEDYQVPSANPAPPMIPIPENAVDAEKALTDNPLYRQTLPSPVRCDMPEINAATASDPELKAHFEQQMACLMRVWGPAFDATKTWQLYRPTVTIYGEDVKTPCGGGQKAGVNALYCPVNQQVYYSRLMAHQPELPTLKLPKMVDLVIAHEFGHAIQGRAGIVGARAYQMEYEVKSKEEALWLARRSETQADCLSGMWLRSVMQSRDVTPAEIKNFYETLRSIGDDRLGAPPGKGNHGLAASRQYWGQMGMSTGDIGKCNTWIVPEEQVR